MWLHSLQGVSDVNYAISTNFKYPSIIANCHCILYVGFMFYKLLRSQNEKQRKKEEKKRLKQEKKEKKKGR